MSDYYQSSGKFSVTFVIYFVLVSLLVFPLLGLAYAYCIWYIPFVYINFFITLFFGFLVGVLLSIFVIKKGKVRNPALAALIGAIGAIVALYFHWASWVDLVINASEGSDLAGLGIATSNVKILQVFSLAMQPEQLWGLIKEINATGTWGIKRSDAVNGAFLSFIWAIEFLLVLGVSSFMTYLDGKKPYCEVGDNWHEEVELPAFNLIDNKEDLIANITKSKLASFDALNKVADVKTQSHSMVTLYQSKEDKNYISITNKAAKTNSKGKIEFDQDAFLEYLSINKSLCKLLQEK